MTENQTGLVVRDVTVRSVEVPLRRPGVPGNGLEWDEAAVAHFQADH